MYPIQSYPNFPKEQKRFLLAEKIKRTLKQKGLTQLDLAKMLKKYPSDISNMLKGDHNFTIELLFRIEVVLDITLIQVTVSSKNESFDSIHFTIPIDNFECPNFYVKMIYATPAGPRMIYRIAC